MTPLPCRSGRRQSAPRYPRWLFFRYMLHGVMAYVPSRSHGYSPANRRCAGRQLQPPHAVFARRQEHGSLSPSRRR
ncbi:hypothetical protein EC2770900_5162 [Escherichia coli 2770900]|nr:hypothetical protein EC2770900_5162 [Escherichia coli 2770900]